MRIKTIFKDIKNYEGLYKISNKGTILNRFGRTKAPHSVNGYLQVHLYKNSSRRHFMVHRLVAEVFIENPKKSLEINHKDGNKQNNKISNLEWVSRKENMEHYFNVRNGEWIRESNIKKLAILNKDKTLDEFVSILLKI